MDENVDVKSLRDSLKVTQSALAKMLGVSTRTIQNWEAGSSIPSPMLGLINDLIKNKTNTAIGDGNTQVAGNGNNVNSEASHFLGEIAAQRRLTEKALEQVDRLLSVIESMQGIIGKT